MPELNYVPDPVPQAGRHYSMPFTAGFDSSVTSGAGQPTVAPLVPTRDYIYFRDSDNTIWFWRGTAGAVAWQQAA